MTELLEKAFAEASKLPEKDQDELARALLDDIAWTMLAEKALAIFNEGKMKPIEEGSDFSQD